MSALEADFPLFEREPMPVGDGGELAPPYVADIIGNAQRTLPVLRYVVGMVDGRHTRREVIHSLHEAGVVASARTARLRVDSVTNMVNETTMQHTGQALVVRDKNPSSLSANPVLADGFVRLREALLPTVMDAEPRNFMTESFAQIYDALHDEENGPFVFIGSRAKELLAARQTRRNREESAAGNPPATKSRAALNRLLEINLPASGDEIIKTSAQELIIATGGLVAIGDLNNLSDRLDPWFGQELFDYRINFSNGSRTIRGVRSSVMTMVKNRVAEAGQLRLEPLIEPGDSSGLREVVGPVDDFLSGKTGEVPLPGPMSIKQALCVYSRLDLLKGLSAVGVQRRRVLKGSFGEYLKFLDVIDPPNSYSGMDQSHSRKEIVVSYDLSEGACVGVGPSLFFPENGGRLDAVEARRVCGGCIVRDKCHEMALKNREKYGVWGATTERERRRELRQQAAVELPAKRRKSKTKPAA